MEQMAVNGEQQSSVFIQENMLISEETPNSSQLNDNLSNCDVESQSTPGNSVNFNLKNNSSSLSEAVIEETLGNRKTQPESMENNAAFGSSDDSSDDAAEVSTVKRKRIKPVLFLSDDENSSNGICLK